MPSVSITQNYFVAYEANAGKIGSLTPAAAREVSCFYTHVKALVEDVTLDTHFPASGNDAADRLANMQRLLASLQSIGKAALSELKKV